MILVFREKLTRIVHISDWPTPGALAFWLGASGKPPKSISTFSTLPDPDRLFPIIL